MFFRSVVEKKIRYRIQGKNDLLSSGLEDMLWRIKARFGLTREGESDQVGAGLRSLSVLPMLTRQSEMFLGSYSSLF